jgi:hypothetical protein
MGKMTEPQMRKHVIIAFVFSFISLAMGTAHALMGWPELFNDLVDAGINQNDEVVGSVAAGWYFGSICMLVFAALFGWIGATIKKRPGQPICSQIVLSVGVGYLLFGVGGCLVRDFGSHFVAFAILGTLLIGWSIWLVRSTIQCSA